MSVLPANIPKRGLTKKEAAEYCGLSVNAFENKVQSLQFPSALQGTKCWDRHALDAALDRLRDMLDNIPRKAATVLLSATGQPWKSKNFQHRWKDVMVAAEIDGLHFHDLRGTAVTMLAEAECTAPQIAAITGHSLRHVSDILDKYLAKTRTLADQAMDKFENAQGTEFANQLQTKAQ